MSTVLGASAVDKQQPVPDIPTRLGDSRRKHGWMVFTSPRALFETVEDTSEYGWALFTLIFLVMLVGYAEVQTGLIDRSVDQGTEKALAALETSNEHMMDRIELGERMDDIRKQGEFNKLLARLGGFVFSPAHMLASLLFIASVLYALVALTGRKPEYHTLMSVCVYSGFVILVGYIVRLAMVIYYRTNEIDTSLGMLVAAGKPSPLVAIDPFRIWFWVLVVIGLLATRQLGRRMAVVSCTLMALIAAGVRVAITLGPTMGRPGG